MKETTFKRSLRLLMILMVFTFVSVDMFAQTATYTFRNQNPTDDAILSVNGTPRETIKKSQRVTMSLNIGDVVTVSVEDKPDLTWYPIFITEQTPKVKPIVIKPNLALGNTDARELGISPLNYYYNTKGIDIREYDPQNVAGSFKKFNIFEGISNECIDWNQTQDGKFIYTEAFHYQPITRAAEINESTFTQNVNDYKKTFNVNLETAFPVPKAPPGTKGSVDFGYEKTNQQTLNNTSYNWSASKKVFSYEMSIKSLGRMRMDQRFLDYIENMAENRYTAKDFVEKYGTHYPKEILYGGQFVKYVSMEKDDYYQAEREDWNVGLGVSKSKDGTKTTTRIPGGYKQTGNNESSQVMGIKLNFGETEEESTRNLLQKTKAQAFYLGGSGFGENWNVGQDNATAVKVTTERISELFYPHILKNDWTAEKCQIWRDAVRAEIDNIEINLPRLAASSKVKTRRFKVRTVKLHKTYEVDDTDKRIKGHVWLVSKTPSVKAVEQTFRDGVPINTIWWENNFTDVFAKGPIAPMHQSKFGKWQVFEQTSDANGNFAPIKFECNGNIYEAGIFGGQDRLDFTSGQQIDLGNLSSSSVIPHKMKLENNKTLAERYHVEITIEFKPSFDFADLFGGSSYGNHRSASTSKAPRIQLPNPTVTRPEPIQLASPTPAKVVKFYGKNGVTLSDAQAIAAQNGWEIASSNEVQAAFQQHNLDVYAFGMMADGRFAVPVQKDHSNFKKGPNIGAVGGNQGFFYTSSENPPAKTPTTTTTANTTTPATTSTTNSTTTQPKDEFIDPNATYYITDAKHNKSLVTGMVYGGGVYHQTPRNSPVDASWYFVPTGDGYYYIYDLRFNKALAGPDYYDHFGGSTHFVYHQDPDGRTNAQWKITPSDVPGKYIITDRKHNNSLVAGDVADNNIYLQPHNNRQNAYWTFTVTKDKAPAIKPNPNATTNQTATTTPATTQPVTNTITPASPGFVRIMSFLGIKNYLHNQNNKLEATQIQSDWPTSQWKLVPVEGDLYRIQNSLYPDQYIHNQDGKLELGKVDSNSPGALWKLTPAQQGVVRIQNSLDPDQYMLTQGEKVVIGTVDFSSYSGTFMTSMWSIEGEIPTYEANTPTTTTPATTTPASTTMKPASPGYVRIQNSWKKTHYIHNQNGKIEDGPIQANAVSDWWSAQWRIVPVHSGWVRIQNKWKPDQYLHNQHGKLEVGTIDPNWASAMWKLVPVHSGWVRIQNSWLQDQYIHNQNGTIEVGKIDPNWASAMWKVE